MRRKVLERSISRLVGSQSSVGHAAVMWALHSKLHVLAAAAFALCMAVPALLGWGTVFDRVAAGVAMVVFIGAATSRVHVLAQVDDQIATLRGSRIRNTATEMLGWLDPGDELKKNGGNLVVSEWQVGDEVFAMTRRADKELAAIAKSRHPQ